MTQTITEKVLAARIAKIQDRAGARNTLAEEDALAALLADEPAFGFRCGYHNQPASLFVSAAARLRSVSKAQEECEPFFGNRDFDAHHSFWLQFLLPLNKAAALDLMRAYQNAGIFRTSEELLKRTERVEFGMEEVA